LANMNLPGVRRIEALIAVLKQKEKEEIAQVSATLPTRGNIEAVVDVEFGIASVREESAALIEKANEALRKLNGITNEGKFIKTEYSYRYRDEGKSDYERRVDELLAEKRGNVLEEVKRKYAEKESALWLVESIEQAKAIVYGEQPEV